MRPVLLTFTATWLVALLGLEAWSAPMRVRSRSVMESEVTRTAQGLALRGLITDDRGGPVSGAPIHARIHGLESRVVRSSEEGAFELQIAKEDVIALAELHGEELPWTLEFAGAPNFGPVQRQGVLDLERAPTQLSLALDRGESSLDEGPVEVMVQVKREGHGLAHVPVVLRVADGPELVGESDAKGRVAFLVKPASVTRFGRVMVEARFPGDMRHASASATAPLLLTRATRLTLRVGREGDVDTGRYRFSGRLTSEDGALPGRTVAIVARGSDGQGGARTQRATLTRGDGVFLVAIEAREFIGFAGEEVEVQAIFEPPELSLQAARSERALLPVPTLPGVPLSWYMGCLAAAGGLGLLALALHLRLWRQLRWRWRRRRLHRSLSGGAMDLVDESRVLLNSRRGREDWLSGVLVERESGRPLAGLMVSVAQADNEFAVRSDEAGVFELGPLQPGAWELSVRGPSTLPLSVPLQLPHGGELDAMRVRLETLRARARDIFLSEVELQAGAKSAWGYVTPADMVSRRRALNPDEAEALEPLQSLVERAWFCPDTPTLDELSEAEHQVSLRREAS